MLYNFLKSITLSVPSLIERSKISKSEICIYTKPEHLVKLLTFLKYYTNANLNNCQILLQ